MATSGQAQRFSQAFAATVGKLLGAPVAVRPAGFLPTTTREFLDRLEEPSACYPLLPGAVHEPPAHEPSTGGDRSLSPVGWVELSPSVARAVLDLLLRGRVEDPPPAEHIVKRVPPRRPLTAIERRLLRRVADAAASELARCGLSRAASLRASDARCEQRDPALPDWPAWAMSFELAMGGQAGALRICLPHEIPAGAGRDSSREPASPGASAGADPGATAPAPPYPPSTGPLELSVALPDELVGAEDLADLAPGDILLTDSPPDGEVIVRVAGIPKFRARLCVSGGKRAIRITGRLTGGPPGASR